MSLTSCISLLFLCVQLFSDPRILPTAKKQRKIKDRSPGLILFCIPLNCRGTDPEKSYNTGWIVSFHLDSELNSQDTRFVNLSGPVPKASH